MCMVVVPTKGQEPMATSVLRAVRDVFEGWNVTILLSLLWAALCWALFLNKAELWLVLAGFVGFSALCLVLDMLLPAFSSPRQKALFISACASATHVTAMAAGSAFEVPTIVLLSLVCGFLIFDLWNRILKRLYTGGPQKYLVIFEEALTLIVAITAICKAVDMQAKLLLVMPAIHTLVEALQDLVSIFVHDSPVAYAVMEGAQYVTLVIYRVIPHMMVLVMQLRSCGGQYASSCGVVGTLMLMLNLIYVVRLLLPFLRKPKQLDTVGVTSASSAPPMAVSGEAMARAGREKNPLQLWYVHGKAYDLAAFESRHPGGRYALRLGQGRDCTAMFMSYHPFTTNHYKVLEKYRVDVPQSVLDEHVVDKRSEGDAFYQTLSQRAHRVLKEAGVDPVASPQRRLYYLSTLAVVLATYQGYVRGSWLALPIFTTASWLLGGMGHDGAHFSCSHYPWINQLCGLGISMICSPLMWYHQHTFGHHSYTNEFEHDPDLHHFSFLRTHERFAYEERYRWQLHRLYVYFHYGLVVFGETIWIPYKMLGSGTIHGITNLPNLNLMGQLVGVLHLVLYFYFLLYLPAATMGGLKGIVFPTLFLFGVGLWFGLFSQINHLNHDSIAAGQNLKGWAQQQVETAANFATDSRLWFYLSNGLNFQIEHHLFPGVNHEHLYLIQPVVRETCKEFGVQYKDFKDFSAVLKATAAYYRELAVPDDETTPVVGEGKKDS